MAAYPDTELEHSETQEKCRLVFPLAALYDATGEEKHRQMLYRVVSDLEKVKHPSGGYYEWDTHYKARYSRVSTTECSLLTEKWRSSGRFAVLHQLASHRICLCLLRNR